VPVVFVRRPAWDFTLRHKGLFISLQIRGMGWRTDATTREIKSYLRYLAGDSAFMSFAINH
jgi:hypothetical protein